MIELRGLSKHYGTKTAVDGLDLVVEKGSFCALIGPSGCGKSTTLRMINRLVPASGGSIHLEGEDVLTLDVVMLRRRMGYVLQNPGLFPHLTVEENIATVPRLLGWPRKRIRDRVVDLMAMVELPRDLARRWPASLSGGQAQRVGVARALAADPPVLLMDEPFGAVDPITRSRLQNEFGDLRKRLGTTVIMVTHDIDEAVKMADTMAILREGQLVQAGSVEEVLDHPAGPFVEAFVGADRGIKKLSRYRVADWMHPLGPGPDAGALDPDSGVRTVEARASLREALSLMMGQASRTMVVVDPAGAAQGTVTLQDIEKALDSPDGGRP